MGTRARVWRVVIVPFVLSRVIVLATLVATRHVFTTLHLAVPAAARDGLLGWDASWYRDIARSGYGGVAKEGVRFFPLFPMLARAVAWLPGIDAGLGALLVANVSALALGFVLYELVLAERDNADLARRAVWLVYLVPPAYVLTMGYAEALFMTCSAVTLLAARKQRWWLAALAAALAGLARPVGALLVLPIAIEAWRARARSAIVLAAAPAVAGFGYLVWARHLSHGLWYPLRVQQDAARRGHWIDPVRAVARNLHAAVSGDHVSAGVHVVAAVVLVGLVVVLGRRWPLSFTVYAVAAVLVALSSRNLDSLERYSLATVPLAIAAADLVTSDVRERVVLTVAGAGLALGAVLVFTGVLVP